MLKYLAAIAMILISGSATCAENHNPIAPFHVEKDPQIIIEADQTDIYAIPLDQDDQDDQMELYKLEHPTKK